MHILVTGDDVCMKLSFFLLELCTTCKVKVDRMIFDDQRYQHPQINFGKFISLDVMIKSIRSRRIMPVSKMRSKNSKPQIHVLQHHTIYIFQLINSNYYILYHTSHPKYKITNLLERKGKKSTRPIYNTQNCICARKN